MINLYTIELFINIVISILAYVVLQTTCGVVCAWVARMLGDSTAHQQGLTSLNPVFHIDAVGMLCLIIFGLGWGSNVPFNHHNIVAPYRKLKIIFLECVRATAHLFIAFIALSILIKVMPASGFKTMGSFIGSENLVLSRLTKLYPTESSLKLIITIILSKIIYLGIILGALNSIRSIVRNTMNFLAIEPHSSSFEGYMTFIPLLIFIVCGARLSILLFYGLLSASTTLLYAVGLL